MALAISTLAVTIGPGAMRHYRPLESGMVREAVARLSPPPGRRDALPAGGLACAPRRRRVASRGVL